ncbi:MAG: DUF1345 domain-containing protein [Thermomicrobiales bacterium]
MQNHDKPAVESLARRAEHEVLHVVQGVPRWPGTIALLAIGLIYLFLPEEYTFGPRWLVLVVIVVFLVPIVFSRWRGNHLMAHATTRVLLVLMTLAVAFSAVSLLVQISAGKIKPLLLLSYASLIWIANIVTFAIWYWSVDGGGPAHRHPGRHASTDFSFPQQQQDDDGIVEGWSPGFIDYLFLAFNTSTAFSPTDTLVLSRRAKVLMMSQALISLVVVAVLLARAIYSIGS